MLSAGESAFSRAPTSHCRPCRCGNATRCRAQQLGSENLNEHERDASCPLAGDGGQRERTTTVEAHWLPAGQIAIQYSP